MARYLAQHNDLLMTAGKTESRRIEDGRAACARFVKRTTFSRRPATKPQEAFSIYHSNE
jgi:hypothetical protein